MLHDSVQSMRFFFNFLSLKYTLFSFGFVSNKISSIIQFSRKHRTRLSVFAAVNSFFYLFFFSIQTCGRMFFNFQFQLQYLFTCFQIQFLVYVFSSLLLLYSEFISSHHKKLIYFWRSHGFNLTNFRNVRY